MKQRTRVFLTLPVVALIAMCALVIMNPLGVGAQSATSQHQSVRSPHLLLRSQAKNGTLHPLGASNLNYGGGPVMAGTAHVYAIFWEPTGSVSANYNSLIKRFFGDVGGNGLYAITNQYKQSSGSYPSNAVLSASWVDSAAYPASPLLDSNIQSEVTHAQQVNGWHSSINNIFFVFLESNTNLCIDSSQQQCFSNTFCAYHSSFGSNSLYAAMPYAPSSQCNPGSSPNNDDADQTINVTSHELIEAVTDPLGNAWIDSSGQEIGDKCNFTFGPLNSQGADVVWNGHPYIVQEEWDNHSGSCRLTPSTTPPPTPTPTNTPSPTPTNTPSPTPTTTPSPTPTPNPGSNLVSNPGFESGQSPWLESTANGAQLVDPTNPHTGNASAYLCGYNYCNDQIGQNITLPSSFSSATFSYWTYINTSETTRSICYDNFVAKLRTAGGTTIATVQKQCNLNAHGWTHYTFNVTSLLNAYKGKAVQVYFQGTTDPGLPTNFFVDDVALTVA